MRWTYAGLFLLLISTLTSAAAGQTAAGDVESIGYNGYFRPDGWVPMVVRVKAATADAAPYQIRVYQHDIDGDRAVYTRTITVNGTSTTTEPQRFWMYFLPDPLHRGLPDQYSGTAKDLAKDLTVFLCDAKGKQLAQLALPPSYRLQNVDPIRDQGPAPPRGSRLVLAVSGNGAKQMQLGNYQQLVGVTQDMEVVTLRVRDLPENPLGYEPVDAVVWLDGDPAELDAGGAHGLGALQDYVRFGGQLVVTQPTTDWQQTASFGDLLPVTVGGVAMKANFEPLRSMAVAPDHGDGLGDATGIDRSGWNNPRGPFQMAKATVRPGSTVEQWIDWGDGSPVTPYLARRSVGLGQVTWVAQPLTQEAQASNPNGWPYIWLSVLGWRSDAYVAPVTSNGSPDSLAVSARKERYKSGGNNVVDLGHPMVEGLNLGSKGAWLIVLAIGFFIVYWLLAGPGTYGYLVAKKKQGLSWFFFAVVALVATLVTVGVVRLVLRGPPEVRHLTVVRVVPGQPTIAYSRFGLYIPKDGERQITLTDTAPGQLSYLSAMAEHPQVLGDASEFPSPLDYDVPIRDAAMTDAPSLNVPYRSSLKKFQARWVGDLSPKISAAGLALESTPDSQTSRLPLRGTLSNDTGQDLSEVYLAFHDRGDDDWVVYKPTWAKGTAFDIQRDLNPRPTKDRPEPVFQVGRGASQHEPGDGVVISDKVSKPAARTSSSAPCWMNYWYGPLRAGSGLGAGGEAVERDSVTLNMAFPMLSLFGRLPPMPNLPPQSNNNSYANPQYDATRAELLTRAGRLLDLGPAMTAGQLVILAQVKGPLPIPVQVDGTPITGEGTTLYQFLLPVDRSAADKRPAPASQPTTGPTSGPTTKPAEAKAE